MQTRGATTQQTFVRLESLTNTAGRPEIRCSVYADCPQTIHATSHQTLTHTRTHPPPHLTNPEPRACEPTLAVNH